MDKIDMIRGMCQFPQRGACTESEEKASEFVYSVMEEEGFNPKYYDFEVWPDFYKAYALHLALAIAFGVLALWTPTLAAGLIIFLLISFYGDLTTKFYWLRKLTRKGKSRHVIGTVGPEDAKRTIVLSGHHDAGQTSKIFEPETLKKQTRFFKEKLGEGAPVFWPLFGGMIFVLISALMRMAGGSGAWPWTFFIIGSVPMAIGIQSHLSMWGKGFSPAANDNASGVAVSIDIARKLKDDLPEDTKIVVLSFGAEETMVAGSGTTVKDIFAHADRENFYSLNFDGVGGGQLRYVTAEGLLGLYHYSPEIIAQVKRVARDPKFSDLEPYVIRSGGTDALPFVHAGLKTISFIALDEDDHPPDYHWKTDVPENIDTKVMDDMVEIATRIIKGL